MSTFSSLTGKFRAQKHSQSSLAASTRQPRESAVCRQCRTSKLRCDRERPVCGNCMRRNKAEECHYDHSVNRRPNVRQHVAEDRLAHLESLVKELIHNQTISEPQYTAVVQAITPDESPLNQVEGIKTRADYVGFTHWSAILDEIDGLKGEISNQSDLEDQAEYRTRLDHQESIFGSPDQYSLDQIIIDHLPSRPEADRLLSFHFQGEIFILPFIHTHYFQTQYQQFWSDTTKVNPLWLSILFSIFHLATLARAHTRFTNSSEEEDTERFHFHIIAGQCLVVGEYHRPQEFVVEALVMYAHCKSVTSLDPIRETGAILSTAVRSAYHLGYHRDPDRFNTFTVFDGEMRRRSWAVCKQLDMMICFQLGLPSNICLENCDTKSPRNLSDTDFGPESKSLPPSRPDDQVTRLLWFVVKDRQMPSFANVCRDALSYREKSESEIRELDQEIRDMHGMIPDHFKARPLAESLGDAPFIVVTRIYIDFISMKSLCVLHRRYMARGNQFSTVACLYAGKRIASQFVAMYREFAPDGILCSERWMLGCYTMNDFLLGTTVLCLYIHTQLRVHLPPDPRIEDTEVLELLEEAYSICVENSNASKDAQRVARVVQLTLSKGKLSRNLPKANSQNDADSQAFNGEPDVVPEPQQYDDAQWNDSVDLSQPFSFADDGTFDLDWAMFDPSAQNTWPTYHG